MNLKNLFKLSLYIKMRLLFGHGFKERRKTAVKPHLKQDRLLNGFRECLSEGRMWI